MTSKKTINSGTGIKTTVVYNNVDPTFTNTDPSTDPYELKMEVEPNGGFIHLTTKHTAVGRLLNIPSAASAPSDPVDGDVYRNTNDNKVYIYYASSWHEWLGGSGATDHGVLSGLGDNDHTQYLMTASAPIVAASQNVELKNNAGAPAQITAIDIDGTFAANSDVRIPTQKAVKTLADTKASTAHKATHITGGSDIIDSVITAKTGLCPAGPNDTTKFLRGDSPPAWATLPATVEDSIIDGHTTVAPSGNAVFDALALKLSIADIPSQFSIPMEFATTHSSWDTFHMAQFTAATVSTEFVQGITHFNTDWTAMTNPVLHLAWSAGGNDTWAMRIRVTAATDTESSVTYNLYNADVNVTTAAGTWKLFYTTVNLTGTISPDDIVGIRIYKTSSDSQNLYLHHVWITRS